MFTLMGSFWEKYILFELKRHRGVIFHDTDTEEWCKIWSGINLLFQNWHEEFVKLWPEYSKVLKFFNLKGSFRARYTLFEVKKYRKVMQSLERNWLVASKLTWGICPLLTQVLESFQKFSFTGLLLCISKSLALLGSFCAKYILFELEKYKGVIFHDTEGWYTIWKGIDLSLQNWYKEFNKFWPGGLKSLKNLDFNAVFLTKVYNAWSEKVQRSYVW